MSMSAYIEAEPLSEITRWHGEGHGNSVPFIGTLRKHPYDSGKCLLISNPGEPSPAIREFRVVDIAGAEELASPVDPVGATHNLVRLWIRKGSLGVKYEPFEVDDPIQPGADHGGPKKAMTGVPAS
jgi:inorganic pyrophosphatase